MPNFWQRDSNKEVGARKQLHSTLAAAKLSLERDPNDLEAQTELAEAESHMKEHQEK